MKMREISRDVDKKLHANNDLEYHEWKTSIIFDAIRSAFGKRPQELLNTIFS
jgi:hypothetical protein